MFSWSMKIYFWYNRIANLAARVEPNLLTSECDA